MNKKIDVLLINPYDENALKNALGFITPPINLMYLASSLEKESYSVKIVDDDLLQKGYKNVSELAEKLNPQVVAVTATTSTIKSGLKYLELAKNILPNSLTVIGGPHATFLPYETLKGSETLDVVVTSVLQTPAGRMIFARLKEDSPRERGKDYYLPTDSEF